MVEIGTARGRVCLCLCGRPQRRQQTGVKAACFQARPAVGQLLISALQLRRQPALHITGLRAERTRATGKLGAGPIHGQAWGTTHRLVMFTHKTHRPTSLLHTQVDIGLWPAFTILVALGYHLGVLVVASCTHLVIGRQLFNRRSAAIHFLCGKARPNPSVIRHAPCATRQARVAQDKWAYCTTRG